MKDKVLGDFDKWFEPCRNCGYDPGKSTKNRCWNCGSGLQRDYSERALNQNQTAHNANGTGGK